MLECLFFTFSRTPKVKLWDVLIEKRKVDIVVFSETKRKSRGYGTITNYAKSLISCKQNPSRVYKRG